MEFIKEKKDWSSEYELRQFIDTATRWDIDAIYNTRKDKPFHIFFEPYINDARENYERFSKQLGDHLSDSKNWKSTEIYLKNKFLQMIDQYIEWYNEHKKELSKFQPHCPYTFMLSIIEMTKDEILMYFPELGQTLHQSLSIEQKKNTINSSRQTIKNTFHFMQFDDPREHKKILNGTDFDNLINFDNNFTEPNIKQPIENINTAKGNVFYTFIKLFDELHPSHKRPESLYKLIKSCFYKYRDDKISNIKKIKKPQYYDDLRRQYTISVKT